MTTSHPHTPSSSFFDVYHCTCSYPDLYSTSNHSSPATSPTTISPRKRRTTSGSARNVVTPTQSLFARLATTEFHATITPPVYTIPDPPEGGSKLFSVSAKTAFRCIASGNGRLNDWTCPDLGVRVGYGRWREDSSMRGVSCGS